MREKIYQPCLPVLSVVPMGVIGGSVTLNPDQYAWQMDLSHSIYIAEANNIRILVGLSKMSPDRSYADYYWLLCFTGEAAEWPGNETSERQLAFARNKLRNVHYDLCEIVYSTKPERMFSPFVIRDLIPEMCPSGPATLIGDASHPMAFCESPLLSSS